MEPAAPGTEEDAPISLPLVSKQESEQERLLSIKARLPNGVYGYVFELSYFNGAEHWYCNVCECPVMGRVYHHEIGKRHTSNMSEPESHKSQPSAPVETTIQVAPGEPVPPGFEGEMEKVAQIQQRLDDYKVGPLIGLEYLFEIQIFEDDKEPSYLCMLCDKRGDPRTVIAHLASYNHISQYVQKHFPTVYRTLSPYITKQYKRNWQSMMQKIAEAIELKFGRLKPHPIDYKTFQENRAAHHEAVMRGKHFSEKSGCTFAELIDKDELTKPMEPLRGEDASTMNKLPDDMSKRFYRKTGSAPGMGDPSKQKRSPSPPVVARPKKKPKPEPASGQNSATQARRRSLSSVSSISSSDLSDFDEKERVSKRVKSRSPRERERERRRSRSRSPFRKYVRNNRPSLPRERDRSYQRDRPGVLPWQRPDYKKTRVSEPTVEKKPVVSARSKSPGKMDEYRKLASAIENDMGRILRTHEKNPEKHPQYNDEWKKFWNRRYKELQTDGKDAANHDFKPEWIVFWNKRMIELHNTDVKAKKDALRKRLGLPDEPAPICFRITGKKPPSSDEKPPKTTTDASDDKSPARAPPSLAPEVIVIDDKDDETLSSRRSHSPWETESRHSAPRRKSRSRSFERDQRKRDGSRDRGFRARDYYGRDVSRERERDVKGREGSHERDYRSRDRDGLSRERDMRYMSSEKLWERDLHYRGSYGREIPDAYKPPRVMRDVTRQPVHSPPLYMPPIAEPEPEDDGEINVVGVLRLLTALEEKLGSLGPKVIDLLAQALAMEKNEANSSETLLDNEVNCVMFETVKEKLKGQLLAGLVEYNQEKAFKNAIKKTASLVHMSGERKKEREKAKPKVDPVKVPGVGTVDKAAIAKQIATALVLQGKTDVSQAELEQLINAVVGMAEASRNSNKPMTTANFMEQLQKQQTVPPKPTPKTESISSTLQALQQESLADTSAMEGLSDSDLQTLLQNFKDLSTHEQHGLISYLKKLEAKEPERVERLRKFVNLNNQAEKPEEQETPTPKKEARHMSPFSSRLAGGNPMVEERKNLIKKEDPDSSFQDIESEDEFQKEKQQPTPAPPAEAKVSLDSDEEYSFEDVFKAATKNVNEKEKEKEREKEETRQRDSDVDLKDAKAIIANLMGNFSAKNTTGANSRPGTDERVKKTAENVPVTSQSQSFGNVPVKYDNLSNIVGNIKNLIDPVPPSGNFHSPQIRDPPMQQQQQQQQQHVNFPQQNFNNMQRTQQQQFAQRPVDMFASGPVQQPVQYPMRNAPSIPPGGNFGGPSGMRPMQNVQYPIRQQGYGNFAPQEPFGGYGRGQTQGQFGGNRNGGYGNRW